MASVPTEPTDNAGYYININQTIMRVVVLKSLTIVSCNLMNI